MSAQPYTQPGAVIRFRRDQRSSGVSRAGTLLPRGRVRIEYDGARLISEPEGASESEIVGHVWFEPSGDVRSSPLLPVPNSYVS